MATRIYRTFGEALADPTSNIARQLERGRRLNAPIKAEVRRLQDQGMSGEQAWTEVMKRVQP